jgi:DNA repair protein RecO
VYHLHYTPGIVLVSRSAGESDRRYRILTRELGVITATAKSVRTLASKLRYALQTYSYAEFVLVRGAGGWRITNAVSKENLYTKFSGRPAARGALTRSLRLINRLTPGEERHEELFDVIEGGLLLLSGNRALESDAEFVEQLLVLRTLALLGYIGDRPDLSAVSKGAWDIQAVRAGEVRRQDILAAINRALQESHL